jgi:hypothetical protein
VGSSDKAGIGGAGQKEERGEMNYCRGRYSYRYSVQREDGGTRVWEWSDGHGKEVAGTLGGKQATAVYSRRTRAPRIVWSYLFTITID